MFSYKNRLNHVTACSLSRLDQGLRLSARFDLELWRMVTNYGTVC